MSKKIPKNKPKQNKPKRSSKRKTSSHPRPEPAQLRAIERLLEAEDFAKAIERARPLVQRFPDHGGAQGLLIEALRGGQGSQFAAVVVHDWAERHPQSLFAQEQLLAYAAEGHCLMLADRVAEQVRALGGEAPSGFPLSDEVKAALCSLVDGTRADEALMVQFDRARLYMNGFAFSKALPYLEALEVTSARISPVQSGACAHHAGRSRGRQ